MQVRYLPFKQSGQMLSKVRYVETLTTKERNFGHLGLVLTQLEMM